MYSIISVFLVLFYFMFPLNMIDDNNDSKIAILLFVAGCK